MTDYTKTINPMVCAYPSPWNMLPEAVAA